MSQTNLEGLELLGKGDPVVVSQQLFEKTNPERIESLLQELQREVVRKNSTLKSILSSNYTELLNCSDLLRQIEEYSKHIAQLSEKPAQTLQRIFRFKETTHPTTVAGNVALTVGIDQQTQSENSSNDDSQFYKPEKITVIKEALEDLCWGTIEMFQKKKLFSIAARQVLSIKLLLRNLKSQQREQSQQQQQLQTKKLSASELIYSKYFGDIELLVTEMSVEIFEESVAHLLSLNEEPVEEEGLDAQNDSRILQLIDVTVCMSLLLSSISDKGKNSSDMEVFLSALNCLRQYNYKTIYIHAENNKSNVLAQSQQVSASKVNLNACVKESIRFIQAFRLKSLESKPTIARFMHYFRDFYGLVKHLKDEQLYNRISTLIGQLTSSLKRFELLRVFDGFKGIEELVDFEKATAAKEEVFAQDKITLEVEQEAAQQQDELLQVVHHLYVSQFTQLSTILKTMLLTKDDSTNTIFFNHVFFQRMMLEEKNIQMIEHIKEVLDSIYAADTFAQNSSTTAAAPSSQSASPSSNEDIRSIMQSIWQEYYQTQITTQVKLIPIQSIIQYFGVLVTENVGQSVELGKYGNTPFHTHLNAQYQVCQQAILGFTQQMQLLFAFSSQHDEAYELASMVEYLHENLSNLLQDYQSALNQIWDEHEENPSLHLMKTFIIFLFFHNYFRDNLRKIEIREDVKLAWDEALFSEVEMFIQDRIQLISDERISSLEIQHDLLGYEQVFELYVFELDEFLSNFIVQSSDSNENNSNIVSNRGSTPTANVSQSQSKKELEISKTILLSIFSALENDRNSSVIKGLRSPSARGHLDNMRFPNIAYILNNQFGLETREYFQKEQDKEAIVSTNKVKKVFKETVTPLPYKYCHFLPLQELIQVAAQPEIKRPNTNNKQPQSGNTTPHSSSNIPTASSQPKREGSSQSQQVNQNQQQQQQSNAASSVVQQAAKNIVGEVSNKFKDFGLKETASSFISKFTKNN